MMNETIERVGIVGAGTMGRGIAQVCAVAKCQVSLIDARPQALAGSLEAIERELSKAVAKGNVSLEDRAQTLGRIRPMDSIEALSDCQLVVEAIPEDLRLKRALFEQLQSICSSDTLLASNTSSLSISALAFGLCEPQRILGLHFFNPVPMMALLEIVVGNETHPQVVQEALRFGARLQKECIVVRDVPGFASSRLGVALGLEAIRMLEEGVATAADIDKAMQFGYGHPMGPLRLGDLVGLDVRLAIAEHIFLQTQNPTFRVPTLLKKMVTLGKLGKKTGEGFYRYD
jgi:3-hydroxybutyryl-CoA dehydrogenase